MNFLDQHKEKINGVLSAFDRVIVRGYITPFQSQRLFLYYLIQNKVQLKDFSNFSKKKVKYYQNILTII